MTPLLKRLGVVVVIVLAGVYVWLMVSGPRGVPALLEKQERINTIDVENRMLEDEIKRRRERIRELQEDPDVQELEALKRLNKKRPGTRPHYLPESSASASTAP